MPIFWGEGRLAWGFLNACTASPKRVFGTDLDVSGRILGRATRSAASVEVKGFPAAGVERREMFLHDPFQVRCFLLGVVGHSDCPGAKETSSNRTFGVPREVSRFLDNRRKGDDPVCSETNGVAATTGARVEVRRFGGFTTQTLLPLLSCRLWNTARLSDTWG